MAYARTSIALWFLFLLPCSIAHGQDVSPESMARLAAERADDLRLGSYVTAAKVRRLAENESDRTRSLDVLRGMGISKVYLEVYRGGTVLTRDELVLLRDFYLQNGLSVAAGIATVPGGDFGVRADRGLGWFNWQNPKTQADLERVVRVAASVFDEFIVDDFLCTGDQSPESDAARGARSWSEYRRDLLTELSSKIFIDPAREVNPDIRMIIKYPQWYDRFHLFGYDVEREPKLYDQVWIGTETRGLDTQRYGFVQPYEGFVNYRWLASIAGEKTGGAWFDHGDCDALDFIDQAWQTVLAGAREIVLFHYGALEEGHPGHPLLRRDFERLADLARAVREHPVVGAVAYKPPHSDAGGDLYLMDFIGMLGVSLVPAASIPDYVHSLFLPTQAAADPQIVDRVLHLVETQTGGVNIVMTSGFLACVQDERLFKLAGVEPFTLGEPIEAESIWVNGAERAIEPVLKLAARLRPTSAKATLNAQVKGERIPFLIERKGDRPPFFSVLNVHTFSQADFDAVGEVLLAPRPLGLLEIPSEWLRAIRGAFLPVGGFQLIGPSRVTYQVTRDGQWLIQNYNDEPVKLGMEKLAINSVIGIQREDVLTGRVYHADFTTIEFELGPRSRAWFRDPR